MMQAMGIVGTTPAEIAAFLRAKCVRAWVATICVLDAGGMISKLFVLGRHRIHHGQTFCWRHNSNYRALA